MRKMVLMLPLLLLFAALQAADAVPFTVENKCGYTVWAAGLPGGGQEVPTGQSWTFEVAAGTQSGRLWGRTGCTFDANGQGSCQTGDCGRQLQCSLSGAPPTTLVEYTLNGNDAHNTDFYDISLIDGFNVPLSVYPTSGGCTTVNCNVDITSICPSDLQTAGGCLSACNKYHQDQYCCTGSYLDTCGPTNYSQFFKQQCPQAYTYAKEDRSSTSTCPSGGGYRIVFCG